MDVTIPNITDLSLLKITKVKNWAIYFDYNNRHFILHGRSEPGECAVQELFERTMDENGHYELNNIKGKFCQDAYIAQDYVKIQKGKIIVYSNIDKEFFVYNLTKHGFATGMMEEKVREEMKRNAKARLARLAKEMEQIQEELER